MGVQDLEEDEDSLIRQNDLTIADLKDIFGREATKRALNYLEGLGEAEQNFKESAKGEKMRESYKETYGEGSEQMSEAAKEWAEAMEDDGLGLDS